MTTAKKRPSSKRKRKPAALPPGTTMDDILRAAVRTPPKPRKLSPLQRFKKIKWSGEDKGETRL